MSADGDGYKPCDYCDVLAFEPKASEMFGTFGALLCSECRRECEDCHRVGSVEEDFNGANKTCTSCSHYQNSEPSYEGHNSAGAERQQWIQENFKR